MSRPTIRSRDEAKATVSILSLVTLFTAACLASAGPATADPPPPVVEVTNVDFDLRGFVTLEGGLTALLVSTPGAGVAAVLHLYDPATRIVTNLGFASSGLLALDGGGLAFNVVESWQGADLNGDGDTDDLVFHIHDPATGITTNLGLAFDDDEEAETAASWQSGVAAAGFVEDPTDRVVAFLEDGTVGGEVGVYLKEVGGDVIAEHNARFEFEPASAIKALIHFHAMRQIQEGEEIDGGPVTLDRQIPWFTELLGSDEPPGGCPALTGADSDTLRNGLREMMRDSDNRWTQAMRDFFGDLNIDATRELDLGMLDTRLSHLIGCFESKPDGHTNAAEDPNRLTLVDAGRMYEAVVTGFLTPERRIQAFELMSSENDRFNEMIDEEAAGTGISAAPLMQFKSLRAAVLKTGSYRKPNLDPPQQYRAVAGWAELPWKDFDCASKPREYVYGAFIHRAESLPERFQISIRSAGVELFREQIRGALESWAACEADLELLGSTVLDAPSEALVGDPLAVVVRNEIVNHGPASPIDAELRIEAQATAGGTVSPPSFVLSVPALGPEMWVLSDPFTIFCDRPGAQTFTFQSRISAANPKVFDPDDLDNLEVTSVVIECVAGIAIDIDNPVPLPPGTGEEAPGPRVQVTALSNSSDELGAPVAFDATLIDRASVRFGQRSAVWNGTGGAAHDGGERIRDVDKNGIDDMVLSFRTGETGLVSGDSEACMKGRYQDGGQIFRFFGCDFVETRP